MPWPEVFLVEAERAVSIAVMILSARRSRRSIVHVSLSQWEALLARARECVTMASRVSKNRGLSVILRQK